MNLIFGELTYQIQENIVDFGKGCDSSILIGRACFGY